MMTLPRPSTSVLSCIRTCSLTPKVPGPFVPVPAFPSPRSLFVRFRAALLSRSRNAIKLPSADHRGYRAAALNVVVVEGKINMDNDERDEEPKEQMVPETHTHVAAQQRHHPREHPRHKRRAHRRIEREAGDGLNAKRNERKKVDESRQR